MTLQTPSPPQTAQSVTGPLPENLLRQPIDYLQAEHLRQRRFCGLLDRILADPEGAEAASLAETALAFLAVELPRHLADEEDFLSRLLASCAPDDRIEGLIALLREEQAQDDRLRARTEAVLSSLDDRELSHASAATLAVFAEVKRRHIHWVKELLLPLARARLGAEALNALGRDMAARRGVPYPE